MMDSPLLRIRDLNVTFSTTLGMAHVLRNIDLDIPHDRIVGVVGESGCGKSTLALAILNLLPDTAESTGEILFDGANLLTLPAEKLRSIRGNRISMIFQDPITSLNPVFSIGTHLIDVQRRRKKDFDKNKARKLAIKMLARVGIPDPESRIKDYPHQFSGGMCQRIMIAMALLTEPELLIADEPTTALDVTIEAQIVNLLQDLRATFKGSSIFISHSLGLISELCDDVIVMYAGIIVESGTAQDIFANPMHPYTRALLRCEVESDGSGDKRLISIPGEVPDLIELPNGCIFADRCEINEDRCRTQIPKLKECSPGHRAACLLV